MGNPSAPRREEGALGRLPGWVVLDIQEADMIPAVEGSTEQATQSKSDIQRRKLKEACQEFESILTGYLFKSMRQSVVKAEEPDQASQIYESMMDDTLARELSRSGSGGMADMLYRELLPLVEASSAPRPPIGAVAQGTVPEEGVNADNEEPFSVLPSGASESDGSESASELPLRGRSGH